VGVDTDVVVIGEGALGLSTALHCALSGRSVVVLERLTAGSQASGRAAGLFKSVQADELRTGLARRSITRALTFADCAGAPLDVLRRLAAQVTSEVPAASAAEVAVHRGGLFTMSPDGRFVAGPVPGLPGLRVASGCNGSGFSSSLAIGEALATWIATGDAPPGLAALSPAASARSRTKCWSPAAAGSTRITTTRPGPMAPEPAEPE
jgi:glycine/D-amino acid oxidase-like deaminating enzyme